MAKITLQICIDDWLTVRIEAADDDEFVSELLHGGHEIDDHGVIHVQSAATDELGRCGWYAARRTLDRYVPKAYDLLGKMRNCSSDRDDQYSRTEHILDRGVESLDLSDRIMQALQLCEITTVRQLVRLFPDLIRRAESRAPRRRRNRLAHVPIGRKSVDDIKTAFRRLGIYELACSSVDAPDHETRALIADRFEDRRRGR